MWCESATVVVSNCVVAGNTADEYGGGVFQGTLNTCKLTGNSGSAGGGASGTTLNNCTVSGNSAGEGGGVFEGTLNNCMLSGNSAHYGGGAALPDVARGFLKSDQRVLEQEKADLLARQRAVGLFLG